MSVTVRLADNLDISRGDMICRPSNRPTVGQDISAMVCWMDETASLQLQSVVEEPPLAVAPPIEVVAALQFTGFLAAVFCGREVYLMLDDVAPLLLGFLALAYI
jgi:hypothetical protein